MVATHTKFTADRRAKIVEALAAGHTLTSAAGLAGVSRQTIYDWLARGEKAPTGNYGAFADQVAQAQALAADGAIKAVTSAMPDDWRAAMEFLSRRFPDDWAKRERHEVSGPKGEPIKVELTWPSGVDPPR